MALNIEQPPRRLKQPADVYALELARWFERIANNLAGIITSSTTLGGDLSGTLPNPTVTGLGGDALPTDIADGFLKRNEDNDAWEQNPYGTTTDTVAEGSSLTTLADRVAELEAQLSIIEDHIPLLAEILGELKVVRVQMAIITDADVDNGED